MNSNGKLFPAGAPNPSSVLLDRYQKLCDSDFSNLPSFTPKELDWILKIHDRYLDYYREERTMHFGAFALVALSFMILLGSTMAFDEFFIPFAAAEGMLLMLLIPYIFVYRKYEEGVRKMMRQAVLIENERQIRIETQLDPN